MTQKNFIKKMLKPNSIAIVGASEKKGKVGNMLVKNITQSNYKGEVFFVNNRADIINGKKVYNSVSEIDQEIDLVIIATPAFTVLDIVRDASKKCTQFIIISAGFGETDEEGKNREKELKKLALEKKLTILGPNCLGILSPGWNLNASFAPGLPPFGDTAFISQSGALAVALIDKANALNIGFSHVLSIGNKMSISETELIEYFASDKNTNTIILYLESITEGVEFLKSVKKARLDGKRIIILKSGKSDEAQKAIALHTGSLTSGDAVTQAVFDKMGIVRAQEINDIFVFASLCHALKFKQKASNIAVITNAGGPGVIVTDELAIYKNLNQASLSKENSKKLADKLPKAASVHNPIDLLGDAGVSRYRDAIDICLQDDNIDTVIVLLTPQEGTPADEIANYIVKKQKETSKLIITSFIGGFSVSNAQKILRDGNVFHTETPSLAISALSELIASDNFSEPSLSEIDIQNFENQTTKKILDIAKEDNNRGLYFYETAVIAKEYGISISDFWDITDEIKDDIIYPCVVKVDDPHILHKSDRGGVILPINSVKELKDAREVLKNRFREQTAKIIAQPLAKIQTELILGMKRDPIFGPVIIVGIGGIYTEIIKKTEVFVSPIHREEIKNRLLNGKLGFLFNGARGQKPYNVDEISEIVLSLQNLALKNPQISEIDINPLLIYNNSQKANAVDMKIVL